MTMRQTRRTARPWRRSRSWLVLLFTLVGTACNNEPGQTQPSAEAPAVAVGSGEPAPPRIVSAGGNVTEVLYALGVGSALVGADTTSTYPLETAALPKVGYLRRLSAEGVVSLRPTLFLGTDDAEPHAALDQLRGAGIRVELVDDAPGLEATYARVLAIGSIVGRRDAAEALVHDMRAAAAPVLAGVATAATRPSVLFIYARGQGSAQVAGEKTAAQIMIELAGGKNAVSGFEGFRPLTAEAVVQAEPDFYLMPALGLQSLGNVEGLLAQPGIAQTAAGRARRVIAIEDSTLLGFGPRVALALRELAARLHPELAPSLGSAPAAASELR